MPVPWPQARFHGAVPGKFARSVASGMGPWGPGTECLGTPGNQGPESLGHQEPGSLGTPGTQGPGSLDPGARESWEPRGPGVLG